MQATCLGQEQIVDLAAADDHYLRRIAGNGERRGRRRNDVASIGQEIGLTSDYNILPAWKRPPDRLPGKTAHDDWLPHRQRFETLQVVRDLPRQFAIHADNVVRRRSDNNGDQFDTA